MRLVGWALILFGVALFSFALGAYLNSIVADSGSARCYAAQQINDAIWSERQQVMKKHGGAVNTSRPVSMSDDLDSQWTGYILGLQSAGGKSADRVARWC